MQSLGRPLFIGLCQYTIGNFQYTRISYTCRIIYDFSYIFRIVVYWEMRGGPDLRDDKSARSHTIVIATLYLQEVILERSMWTGWRKSCLIGDERKIFIPNHLQRKNSLYKLSNTSDQIKNGVEWKLVLCYIFEARWHNLIMRHRPSISLRCSCMMTCTCMHM
jgi:hypothetical protein